MPGPWSGLPVHRLRSTISLKFPPSKADDRFGTSSTRTTPIGNTNDLDEDSMNATTATLPLEPNDGWTPSKGVVGMKCLISAERDIFMIFVVAYLLYLGKNLSDANTRNTE